MLLHAYERKWFFPLIPFVFTGPSLANSEGQSYCDLKGESGYQTPPLLNLVYARLSPVSAGIENLQFSSEFNNGGVCPGPATDVQDLLFSIALIKRVTKRLA
jgi:hypothetical protein